jgi:hypothetical protein
MQLVPTRQAIMLTGLTTAKLREWTSRRALIPADVAPKTQGSPAQYGWQTILVLRLAVQLRDRFHVELQAHRAMSTSLRGALRGTSFIVLWGRTLALHGGERWTLIDSADSAGLTDDAVLIRLDPHLQVLAAGFALPQPSRFPGQLDLFPLQPVPNPQAPLKRPRSMEPAGSAPTTRRRVG